MNEKMCPPSLAPRPRLGIILSLFPRFDETFILRDLVVLSQKFDLSIFSLKSCRDKVIHDEARPLIPKTYYAAFLFSLKVWRSNLHFLKYSFRDYSWALGWVITRHFTHPVVLLKNLLLFPKTVYFAKIAQEKKLALIHAGWATYPTTAAIIMSRLTRIPYSMWTHAHDIYDINPALTEKLKRARFVITCTEYNKRHLEKIVNTFARSPVRPSARSEDASPTQPAYAPTRQRANIIVNYHGVDLSKFTPKPKTKSDICHILGVGTLRPAKDFGNLIDACALLRDREFKFTCTIAGGGPLEQKYRHKITHYALNKHVKITGTIAQDDVRDLYQDAHIFVMPAIPKDHWGIPNVFIEALAMKTPVIACALNAIGELVVNEESGLIIPEQNPKSLADAIRRLWSDEKLRERLAETGYQCVLEKFALKNTGTALLQIFSGVIKNTDPVSSRTN